MYHEDDDKQGKTNLPALKEMLKWEMSTELKSLGEPSPSSLSSWSLCWDHGDDVDDYAEGDG